MFSKLDAVIIGALWFTGIATLVEARNSLTIASPDAAAVELAVPVAPARLAGNIELCATPGANGDFMFMRYAGRGSAAMADAIACRTP